MRPLNVPDRHSSSPERSGWERTSRNPGCPKDDRRAGLAGGTAVPTSQGWKTSEAERLPEARQDVTMLAISRDPEHQDLIYGYPGSAGRFTSACHGGPASHNLGTCQLCARSKRRSGSPSATRREAESLRCETVQVGRHPYLVTRAAVLVVGEGVPLTATLHAHKSRDEGVGGRLTSAGTSWGCYADEVQTCRFHSPSVVYDGGRPPYCRRVSFRAPALMGHREKRRSGPPALVGSGARTCQDRTQACMKDECRQGRDRSAPKLRRGPECVSLLRGVYTVVAVGMEFVDWLHVVRRPLMVTLEGFLFLPSTFFYVSPRSLCCDVFGAVSILGIIKGTANSTKRMSPGTLRHLRPQPCLERTSSLWVAFFLVFSSLRWCSSS